MKIAKDLYHLNVFYLPKEEIISTLEDNDAFLSEVKEKIADIEPEYYMAWEWLKGTFTNRKNFETYQINLYREWPNDMDNLKITATKYYEKKDSVVVFII